MVAMNCIRCGKEFKVSGADFKERKREVVADLCPICVLLPPAKEKELVVLEGALDDE